jgi:hypothetical protein
MYYKLLFVVTVLPPLGNRPECCHADNAHEWKRYGVMRDAG